MLLCWHEKSISYRETSIFRRWLHERQENPVAALVQRVFLHCISAFFNPAAVSSTARTSKLWKRAKRCSSTSAHCCIPPISVWFFKVHIFWEGHKILQNLHLIFVPCSGDFAKFCRITWIRRTDLTNLFGVKKYQIIPLSTFPLGSKRSNFEKLQN